MMWSKSVGATPAMRNAFSPAIRVASLKVRSFIWVSITCSVDSPMPRAHAHAGAAGLAVRDDRDVAEPVVQGGHRVADLDDEGATAHRGAVHVARRDAERLAEQRG